MTKQRAEELLAMAAAALPNEPRVTPGGDPREDVAAILRYRVEGLTALPDALRMLELVMEQLDKLRWSTDLASDIAGAIDLLREWEAA